MPRGRRAAAGGSPAPVLTDRELVALAARLGLISDPYEGQIDPEDIGMLDDRGGPLEGGWDLVMDSESYCEVICAVASALPGSPEVRILANDGRRGISVRVSVRGREADLIIPYEADLGDRGIDVDALHRRLRDYEQTVAASLRPMVTQLTMPGRSGSLGDSLRAARPRR